MASSSSSAGLDAFYQEVGFHLGLPTNTIQLKMQQEMRGFTAKDLKLILQLLKDRYREILGYNHDELLVSGSRQQLVERLTRFLSGTGMQTLMENGGFSTSNQPSAGRSSSSGGHATRGATTRASSSAAAARSGEEEVICLLSDSEEEEQQQGNKEEEEEEEEEDDHDDDEDEYESEEEEYTERRRRGRRRLSTHRQAARPPAPPPPPALAHAYQPHQQPPGYFNPMHPPAHNPALLAFLAGNGMGFMPGPGGQYNPALAAAAFGRGGGGLPQGAMGGMGPMGVPMGMPMGLGAMGGLGMGGMMMGEPKRSSAGGGGGPPSPPGKKARGSHQAGGGAASSVEVKEEKVDPYRAMNPTREEQRLVGQMMLESGIPAAESLTALRASNWEIDKAIQWFVSALDMDVTEIQSLAQASIESEAINDNRKKGERLQMDELRYSGDVVASNLFEESVILNERQGSKAVRLFVREHCTASPSSPSSSGDPPAAPPVLRGPMAERRNHVVRILMWEKQGIRCYKDPARAYVRQLIQRLDEPLVRAGATEAQQQQPGTGGGDDEARWERLLPLALVSREADALQACIVDYPQGNTGGVPPLFLEAQGRAADLDRDGVQLMEVLDQGSTSSSTHHHVHTSAAAPGKGGSRRSSGAPVECIELLDDD